jgi:hypothetical protein
MLGTVCAGRLWNAAWHSVCAGMFLECCLAQCVLLKALPGRLIVQIECGQSRCHNMSACCDGASTKKLLLRHVRLCLVT